MTNKEKKNNLLTIEKELLGSYMEAVADLKNLRKIIDNGEGVYRTAGLATIDSIIAKHIERISSSDIWEAV